jgi:hypothetical protein
VTAGLAHDLMTAYTPRCSGLLVLNPQEAYYRAGAYVCKGLLILNPQETRERAGAPAMAC